MRGSHRSLAQQVNRLNPAILGSRVLSLEQIYLGLKHESIQSGAIPRELATLIKDNQGKHFRMEDMDSEALTIFYRNAVRALMQRAAQLWREEEVAKLSSQPFSPAVGRAATHLLDTFFSPNGLNDSALTVREAEAYFAERPWKQLNWSLAFAAMEEWLNGRNGSSPFQTFTDPKDISSNDANRIRLALSQARRTGECCLTEPGCTLCPNNRGWRR